MKRLDNLAPRTRARALRAALFACCVVGMLAGCGAPTAGLWTGTADIGPFDAFPLVVMLPTEGLAGEVELKLADGAVRFAICEARARNGAIEIAIDWTHRDCKVPAGAQADRRVLRGVAGEGVMAGEIFQGSKKVGFFRAYRAPEA